MRNKKFKRREFTKSVSLAGIGVATFPLIKGGKDVSQKLVILKNKGNLKISLNAYSFDKPLRAGKMTIDDLLDYCAKIGFDGVDLTGYYFPGYPAVPPDDYIFHVKQKAFRLGIDMGCTGVKNDFTWSDPVKRADEKKLVKEWIIVAQKLGAPGVRIFSGTLSKENFSWDERAKWIADDIRECAEYGKTHGVMLALQNHNDFLKTASQTEKLLNLINHDWVGLMLDIGSYRTEDPYKDIVANSKYAITWQMKEKVFIKDAQVDTDYEKIIAIVRQSGYRGYLPLETLGEGDPYQKVEALFNKVNVIVNR
ncbi:MAG: sugar phosphate isomerase/epimerase [Bacteroidia bacterium]|nr:sugar phosphate isomerase/epimerase [Bacteroidia bacterium]